MSWLNPFGLSASDLLIWGWAVHMVCDWPLQNAWMAQNKMLRRPRRTERVSRSRDLTVSEGPWWDRHPAAYVHAGIHTLALLPVFGWAALLIGLAHLLIDTRHPVVWLSKLMRQDQPEGGSVQWTSGDGELAARPHVDVGVIVRFWADQSWHVATLMVAAIVVTL